MGYGVTKKFLKQTFVPAIIIGIMLSSSGGKVSSIAPTTFYDIGGTNFSVVGINDSEMVVGTQCCKIVEVAPGNNFEYQQATYWTPSTGIVNVGSQITNYSSQFSDVNNQGEAVGYANFTSDASAPHAITWTQSAGLTDLGTFGGYSAQATAVNNQGEVVGVVRSSAGGDEEAFAWTPSGGIVYIAGTLGSGDYYPTAVNDNGEVVGQYFDNTVQGGHYHAFSWTPSDGMVDLGSLIGSEGNSGANDINNNGEIVGFSNNQTDSDRYNAVYWTSQRQIEDLGGLGVPGAQHASANGINDSGEIVGDVQSNYNNVFKDQPFYWSPSDGPTILPGDDSGTGTSNGSTVAELTSAKEINNSGQIAGFGVNFSANGNNDGIIWGIAPPITNLTATSPTNQSPVLNWDAVSGATSYNVYRNGTAIGSTSSTTYTDSSAPEGTIYYYVAAVDGSGEIGQSNVVSVIADRSAPALGMPAWSSNPISTAQSTTVTIPVTDSLTGVLKGEYYLGSNDPGQGNGTAMSLSGGNLSSSFSNLAAGIYTVNFRAADNAGNWSATTTDYLVVYNPQAGGMSGHSNTVAPVYGVDALPGLIQSGQADKASFALSVKYDNNGSIASNSKLKFSYTTGTNCNKPAQAVNCHSITLDSNSIQWLVIGGDNDSQGTIQGIATLTVDGVTTTNTFRLVGLDGVLLNPQADDNITLQIFAPGDNPNTASPLYHINDAITKGSIKII